MTAEQASAAEAAWSRYRQVRDIKKVIGVIDLASADMDHDQVMQEIEQSDNPAGVWERVLSTCAIECSSWHSRKMACLLLANIKATNGDPAAYGLLRSAAILELEHLRESEGKIPALKVQVLSGGTSEQFAICRKMQSLPAMNIDDELRQPRLPNPECPASRGDLQHGYCTCIYVPWHERWNVRRPPGQPNE